MSDHSNYPDNPIDVDRLVRRLNYYGSIIEKLLAFKIPHSVAFLEKKIVALEEMILQIPINDDEVEDESSAYQELVDVWRDSVVCLWKRLFDVAALASTTNSAFIDVSSTSAGCGNVNCNRNSKATQATSMKSSGAESSAPSPLQKQKKVLAQPDAMSVPSTSADGP